MFADILITALLVFGAYFGFVGSFSLIKLPDAITRLHGPTKSATLGVGSVLLASLAYMALKTDTPGWHELLIPIFLLVAAPISGNVIAKTVMHMSWRPSALPKPSTGGQWRTYGRDSLSPMHEDAMDEDAIIGK